MWKVHQRLRLSQSQSQKNKKKPKKMEKPQNPEKKGARGHHVQVRCRIPGCSAWVCDIKRHLRTHLKREEINEDDIDSYAEIMQHEKQKSLVSSGNSSKRGKTSVRRRKKWCPMPQCTTICVRMDKHLQHVHTLRVGTVPYKVHLKEAKLYKGIMELDDHPCSVLAGEPSTSSAGPQ